MHRGLREQSVPRNSGLLELDDRTSLYDWYQGIEAYSRNLVWHRFLVRFLSAGRVDDFFSSQKTEV
jgi:hypothetical protein